MSPDLDCDTCLHYGVDARSEPCTSCVPSNWTPKLDGSEPKPESDRSSLERRVAALEKAIQNGAAERVRRLTSLGYMTGRVCGTCRFRNISMGAPPCRNCVNADLWEIAK